MNLPLCSNHECYEPGTMGCGWGVGTGLVQWWCPKHFVGALVRLAGILQRVGLLREVA